MYEVYKQKNEAIASMMWKLERGKYYFEWWKDSEGKSKIPAFKNLLFHTDANWQYEALDFVEKQGWHIEIQGNEVSIYDDDFKFFANGCIICAKGSNRKSTIFGALYEFSKIYKKRNENKNKIQNKTGERLLASNKE